jgi:hypothetical protein
MRIRLPRPLVLATFVALAAVLGLPSRPLEAQAGPPLTVTISGPTGTILSGAQTTYTANASGGAGGYTYAWGFGDGRSATGNPITTSWSMQELHAHLRRTRRAGHLGLREPHGHRRAGATLTITPEPGALQRAARCSSGSS